MDTTGTQGDESTKNQMLERVTAILDAVGSEAVTATEIADRTGLSKSTAHRVVRSMEAYEFLSRQPDGRYSLGRRMLSSPLQAVASPFLATLREKTGETAQLWVRQGGNRLCVESLDSPHRLRITAETGLLYPLHGSAGKILASEDLSQTLEEQDWVESIEERTPGLSSVSAPIVRRGTVIAAVCLAVPVARIHKSPGQDYGDLVVQVANDISEAF